jgi:hypothetical protein
MNQLLRINAANAAAAASLVGNEAISQILAASASRPVFAAFASLPHQRRRQSAIERSGGKVARSLVLYHGPGGGDARSNLSLLTPIAENRFYCLSRDGDSTPRSLRAFLSPSFDVALSFACVTRLEDAGRIALPQSLASAAATMQQHMDCIVAVVDRSVAVRSVLMLRVDFLSDRSLPYFSGVGPVSSAAGAVSFLEDDAALGGAVHPCISYLDVDHFLTNFAVLRASEKDIAVSPLALVHVCDRRS